MGTFGFQPGRGVNITPSHDATWTEDFNKMLKEYKATHKYNRNSFTQKCIEVGLNTLKKGTENTNETYSEGVFIPIKDLSEEQVEFLNSSEGQNTMVGIIKMLTLGGAGETINLNSAFNPQTEQERITTSKEETSTQNETAAAQTENDASDIEDDDSGMEVFGSKINGMGGISL